MCYLKWGGRSREALKYKNMAAHHEDYLVGDDLEAVLALTDEDILEENSDFTSVVTEDVNNISKVAVETFNCDLCSKICVSKRGLSRHQNAKHSSNVEGKKPTSVPKKQAEEKLHPLFLKRFMENAVVKLSNDECYPPSVMAEFKMYNVGSLDAVLPMYQLIRHVIDAYNGDAEDFYPKFYKAISEAANPFGPNLTKNCGMLLGMELANHVLAHSLNIIVY